MKNLLLYSALLIFVLSSCFKEDEKVEPYPRGNLVTRTIGMTQYYTYQVYFDLEDSTDVATNNKNEWDIGFEANKEGFHVILNSSAFMYIGNTGSVDFSAVFDTTGLDWKYDKSDGDLDSTAVGSWFTMSVDDTVYRNHVYVVDRGFDDQGNLRGLKKIQFLEVNENKYKFRFANLSGSGEVETEVEKRETIHFICYSFDNGGEVKHFEPDYDTYDLLFTQYTTLLYTDEGDPYPYLVTGVLLNREGVAVALDSAHNFHDLERVDIEGIELSANLDAIGYDWKVLQGDVNSGNVSYNIVPNRNYIIRNRNGFIYKFRFIEFYNTQGEKGYPTVEFKLL